MGLLALATVAGCGDADVGEEDLSEVGADGADGADGVLEVGESSEAIWKDAWNGSCAQSLTLRFEPGGGYKCGYQMTYGTALYVFSVTGNWAYVYVGSGLCGGTYGFVLKDYVSRNCLL